MLQVDPRARCKAHTFLNGDLFVQDLNVMALRFLECLADKDDTQRLQFLRGLPDLIFQKDKSPLAEVKVLRYVMLGKNLLHGCFLNDSIITVTCFRGWNNSILCI